MLVAKISQMLGKNIFNDLLLFFFCFRIALCRYPVRGKSASQQGEHHDRNHWCDNVAHKLAA